MAKRKKGKGGSFATNFLGPGDSSRPKGAPNYGRGYGLGAAGKKQRKPSKGIYGTASRRKG